MFIIIIIKFFKSIFVLYFDGGLLRIGFRVCKTLEIKHFFRSYNRVYWLPGIYSSTSVHYCLEQINIITIVIIGFFISFVTGPLFYNWNQVKSVQCVYLYRMFPKAVTTIKKHTKHKNTSSVFLFKYVTHQ